MNGILRDVLIFLSKNYQTELCRKNLTKMVYLCDWHYAIKFGKQITNIKWYNDIYGPDSEDIKNTIVNHPEIFSLYDDIADYKFIEKSFKLVDDNIEILLKPDVEISLNHIIKITKEFDTGPGRFIHLVYSTFPFRASESFIYLDLIDLAKRYTKGNKEEEKRQKKKKKKIEDAKKKEENKIKKKEEKEWLKNTDYTIDF